MERDVRAVLNMPFTMQPAWERIDIGYGGYLDLPGPVGFGDDPEAA